MKRFLVFPLDFDTRARLLEEPGKDWDEQVRTLHEENRSKIINQLRSELGLTDFEEKLKNFRDVGSSPFSIISYHNGLYRQARYAFIYGLYYPALVAACALGERILNHLILDLRSDFSSSPHYKSVFRKESFDNWEFATGVLKDWKVFQHDDVETNFAKLRELRHRSIHFDNDTYRNLRSDALSSLGCISRIIETQFGFVGSPRWMIPGTRGAFFIKKEGETDAFIKRYYLPQCPLVGPYYAVKFVSDGVMFFDRANYEEREISDAEFAALFDSRTPDMVVSSSFPPIPNVKVVGKILR